MADDKPTSLHDDISAAYDQESQAIETPVAAPVTPEAPVAAPPVQTEAERARDEQGRFAKTDGKPTMAAPVSPDPGQPQPVGQAVQVQPAEAPPVGSPLAPPPGWSVAAKAEFDKLPQPVKEAVAQREQQVSEGFAKYHGLGPWVEMATQNNTTLPQAVERWMAAEQLLENDFGSGILGLCQHYNIDPAQLGQFLSGGGQQQPQDGQQQQPDAFAPVMRQLTAVEQRLAAFEQQQQQAETASVATELQRFAADPANKFYENVRKAMGQLLAVTPGASLKDLYDQACWLNPDIRALRIKEQSAAEAEKAKLQAESARNGARSLPTGSPLPGANSGTAPKSSLRAEIEAAYDANQI